MTRSCHAVSWRFLTDLGHTWKQRHHQDRPRVSSKGCGRDDRERHEGRTILDNSPVKSSGSKGVIERGGKEFEYQVRTMKSALDERIGNNVRSDSNILPWMIEFSSVPPNRYSVGKDGSTAYERMKEKRSPRCLASSSQDRCTSAE